MIKFSLKIKGIDNSRILLHQSLLYEIKLEYKKALKRFQFARIFAYDPCVLDYLKSGEKFIKRKMARKAKKIFKKAKN